MLVRGRAEPAPSLPRSRARRPRAGHAPAGRALGWLTDSALRSAPRRLNSLGEPALNVIKTAKVNDQITSPTPRGGGGLARPL